MARLVLPGVWGHTIAYTYDLAGNRKTMTLDSNAYASYDYDAANNLIQLVDEAEREFDFEYDAGNRLGRLDRPNGIYTSYGYDGMSRLVRQTHKKGSFPDPITILFDEQISYNSANQISQIVPLNDVTNKAFSYDELNRLKTVSTGESFSYDEVGNRTNIGYTTGAFNRLTNTSSATYNYNNNGSLTSKTVGLATTNYTWDRENRLTAATRGSQGRTYKYDALGRRIWSKNSPGFNMQTMFTHDGLDVIMDTGPFSAPVHYHNGPGIDNKLQASGDGWASYFLPDYLGSTVKMSDANANITATNSYSAFGIPTNSSFSTRYQFTGREYDSFTGLQYSRARFYDPQIGRFISEDPIGFGGGDVNLYGYVGNNPISRTDPNGLCWPPSECADWLDDSLDVAQDFYGVDPPIAYTPGLGTSTTFGTLHGLADMLRCGSGMGQAYYSSDENGYGRAAFGAMDVARCSGLFATLGSLFVPRVPPSGKSCPTYAGTEKPWRDGATPNSVYTWLDDAGRAKQNAVYNGKGEVIGHVDFKRHGTAPSGHGHKFQIPGNPSSGHGSQFPHIPYNQLPSHWPVLPPGVKPAHPIGF